MSAQAIKALRKVVNRPKIEPGTVVRFTVTFGADLLMEVPGETYQYAAMFVNNFWYLTSQREVSPLDDGSVIRPRLNQHGFEQVLASPQVSGVEVASDWTAL